MTGLRSAGPLREGGAWSPGPAGRNARVAGFLPGVSRPGAGGRIRGPAGGSGDRREAWP